MQYNSQPNSRHNSGKGGVVARLVLTALLLVLSVVVWMNRQYIADSVQFWQYEPTPAIESIVKRTALSDGGQFMLYASHPTLDGSQTFNKYCGRKEQHAAILGCYTNNRIYLFNITDQRLDGIREVTAAHEMLHAVYVRMSDSDKERIGTLLEKEYQRLAANKEYQERMAFYARTQPGERQNELHSIIGTEIRDIDPALEAHYTKYFTDRKKVVSLHDGYSQVFRDYENKANELRSQIDDTKNLLERRISEYEAVRDRLESDIDAFQARAEERGGFSSQSEFTNARRSLENRIAAANALRSTIIATEEKVNGLIKEYNSTVEWSQDLYKSLDSTLAPAPTV